MAPISVSRLCCSCYWRSEPLQLRSSQSKNIVQSSFHVSREQCTPDDWHRLNKPTNLLIRSKRNELLAINSVWSAALFVCVSQGAFLTRILKAPKPYRHSIHCSQAHAAVIMPQTGHHNRIKNHYKNKFSLHQNTNPSLFIVACETYRDKSSKPEDRVGDDTAEDRDCESVADFCVATGRGSLSTFVE